MAVGQLGINACALYGGSGYATGWLGINYLIILAGFSIIAFVYMLSRFMPANVAGKISSITRVEIFELIISAIIITALIAVAAGACNVSTVISQSVTGSSLDPFHFADFYIGNLTFNTGLSLLTNVYALSIDYSIDSNLLAAGSGYIGGLLKTPTLGGVVQVSFPLGFDLGVFYGILGSLFLTVFAPLIVTALGMLFIQWLSIPVIQATAFVIVLPIAIAMRSIAYASAGSGLRQAANSLLAIAIAAYIIYPLIISFSPCIVSWIYGQSNCFGSINPAAQYLPSYTVGSLSPQEFSSLGSSQINLGSGILINSPAIGSLLNSALTIGLPALDPFTAFAQISSLINSMAQFMFIAVFLFVMDILVTVAFAAGLYKALNAGLEGATPLWSNL